MSRQKAVLQSNNKKFTCVFIIVYNQDYVNIKERFQNEIPFNRNFYNVIILLFVICFEILIKRSKFKCKGKSPKGLRIPNVMISTQDMNLYITYGVSIFQNLIVVLVAYIYSSEKKKED